jgi:hypothetical protein
LIVPKPDFRTTKKERRPWVTQEVVKPEEVYPDSPPAPAPADTTTPIAGDGQKTEQPVVHERAQPRKKAATQAQQKRSTVIETLYRQLQSKKHLSSYTFRYRPEELDELERIFTQIDTEMPGKLSRNDIARLALSALFEDYHTNGEASTLALVLKRM